MQPREGWSTESQCGWRDRGGRGVDAVFIISFCHLDMESESHQGLFPPPSLSFSPPPSPSLCWQHLVPALLKASKHPLHHHHNLAPPFPPQALSQATLKCSLITTPPPPPLRRRPVLCLPLLSECCAPSLHPPSLLHLPENAHMSHSQSHPLCLH